MTRSSRTRRAKARARKNATNIKANRIENQELALPVLNQTDKRYLVAFTVMSLIITAIYWMMGGRNLFIFPALMCISVGARKYWTGPVRRFANNG